MNARALAFRVLERVETGSAYSDIALAETLARHGGLPARDRALATDLVFGTLRWQRRLDYTIDRVARKGAASLPRPLLLLLRLGAYQLLFLDRVPAHSAVDETVSLVKRAGLEKLSGVANGILRSIARMRGGFPLPESGPVEERLSIIHSHPKWLVARWIESLGEAAAARRMEANNEIPPFTVRANARRCDRDVLKEKLHGEEVESSNARYAEQGLVLKRPVNLARLRSFREGDFVVQDEGSQLAGALLDVKPGHRVLDACAAPGGKATQISGRLRSGDALVAIDIRPQRLRRARENALRMGETGIAWLAADSTRPLPLRDGCLFDRVLVDAPCSGLGTLRRNPEIRWRFDEGRLAELHELQYRLLENLAERVALGGVCLYVTCSTEQEENEDVVYRFLSRRPEFHLESAGPFLPEAARSLGAGGGAEALVDRGGRGGFFRCLPERHGTDGFFAARLERGTTGD